MVSKIVYQNYIYESISNELENNMFSETQGETVSAYHGTPNKKPFSSFSREYLGLNTEALDAKEAFYFTNKYEMAHEVLEQPSSYTLSDNIKELFNKKVLSSGESNIIVNLYNKLRSLSYVPTISRDEQKILDKFNIKYTSTGIIYTVELNLGNNLVYDFKNKNAEEKELVYVINYARNNGYDSITIKNIYDFDMVSTNYIVFDENRILIKDYELFE